MRGRTIKDRIDAGEYPKDDKGRPLVPVGRDGPRGKIGWTATILATDAPEGIVGFGPSSTCTWTQRGRFFKPGAGYDDGDLLPPSPPPTKPEALERIKELALKVYWDPFNPFNAERNAKAIVEIADRVEPTGEAGAERAKPASQP